MTRSVLFALLLALTALVALSPSAPAWAEEKKGIFSFFNRQKDNGGSGPIHMNPGTDGAAKGEGAKAYGFGKSTKSSARYEDSPINDENARAKAGFAKWLAADKAQTLAAGAALNEQMRAEQAQNEQIAKQQQAEKIAQATKAMSAGTAAPAGSHAAMAQALRDQARAQATGKVQGPNGMIVPPPSSRLPQSTGSSAEETTPGTKRPARPQGLFNRIDE